MSSCVCGDVDVADVLNNLAHIVHNLSALTCDGAVFGRIRDGLDEDTLDIVDKQLVGTLCNTRMLRNGFARINRLPPEVLGNIFSLISDETEPGLRKRKRPNDWLIVLRVCRYWRVLAYSTPHLWTHIDIRDPHDDDPDGLPRRSLLHSREALLTVHLHHPSKHQDSSTYHTLLSQMWRVRELHVHGVYSVEDLADFRTLPAPFLDTLLVHVSPEFERISHWQPTSALHDHLELPALFAQNTPRLSYLAVEKFRISPQNPFTRLKQLWLRPSKFAPPRDLGLLLALLDANSGLEDLIVESAVFASPIQQAHNTPALRRISLPALRRFVFNTCEAGFVALLLAHLSLPAHTAMRLLGCSAHGHWSPSSVQSRVLLPANVSALENILSVNTLALQLGSDADRHICAVSRVSPSDMRMCPVMRRSGSWSGAGVASGGGGGALWISDRTHPDGWIMDKLCPSLPLAQIDELWLTGFDNRPPQKWQQTFLSMPSLTKLVLTDANWNAEDWLHALSMDVSGLRGRAGAGSLSRMNSVDSMNMDVVGDGESSTPQTAQTRACPGLHELHVRAPSATLWGPLNAFLQDRAKCGLPIRRLLILLLPSQRPEVVQLFTTRSEEWLALVKGEIVVEVVERFPRMPLPPVCAHESKTNGFWPSWHESCGY